MCAIQIHVNPLTVIVSSRSRAEILRLLFERPGTELHLRELHRRSGLSIRPVQQELRKLASIGLVIVRTDGNRSYYGANTAHPLFPEIRGLVEKTTGVRAVLEQALRDPGIRFAFIFGSVASRKARPESDLDLFVIGDLGLRKLAGQLSGLSDRIGREINPHVMTEGEFTRRRRARDRFVTQVVSSDKTFVIGTEHELEQLGK